MSPIVWIVLIVLAVIVIGGILIYNGLIQRRLRIDEAFAQIEVQLKRRWDLIPNLVNAVKGYMGFEQSVLENVTQARANAVAAGAQGPAAAGRRRERADRHTALALRGGRELSRAEGEPERSRAPGATDDDREPDRVRTPALQRLSARLQHRYRDDPERPHRRAIRLPQAREFFDAEPEASQVPQVDLGTRISAAASADHGSSIQRRRRQVPAATT